MQKICHDKAWEDYLFWQSQDKKTIKKINNLIKDIERSPYEGIGKPERLKYGLSECYSRRIDDTNRLVYRIKNECIEIIQCRTHYEK